VRASPGPPQTAPATPAPQSGEAPASNHSFDSLRVSRVRSSPGPPQAAPATPALQSGAAPASTLSIEDVQDARLLLGLLLHPATPAHQSDAASVLLEKIVLRVSSALAFTWAFLPLLQDCTLKKTNITGNHQGALQKPYDKTFMCTKSH
jgi:hypothetical protein